MVKKSQEELHMFRAVADQAHYGMAIANMNWNIVYVNNAFAAMHGWKAEDLAGKPITIFHNKEQLAEVDRLVEVIHREGGFFSEEVWRIKKDGTVFPSLMSAKSVKDSTGKPQYMSATVIDITKIKETERSLIESQERLHLAQVIAHMGSWDYNISTGRVRWSKNYYHLLGVETEKTPLSLEEIKTYVHPADKHIFEAALLSMQQTRKKVSIEFRIRMPGQSMRWIQSDIMPVFTDNQLSSVHGVSIDITERKKQEAEIRKLSIAIEQSPVAIVITDLDANIQHISPAFSEITGYSAKDIRGENARILKSGFTPDETYDDMWETIRSGKVWKGEWINKKKDKSFYWESVVISPVYDEHGVITNYLAVKEDISDRKKAEQKIRELNINLEKKVAQRTDELSSANAELEAEVEERRKIEHALIQKTYELEKFFDVTVDLLCIANSNGVIIKANKAWETILGYPPSTLEQKEIRALVHPEDVEKTYTALKDLEKEERILNYIVRLKTIDGQYRDMEWHVVWVDGRVYAAARDITERVQLERSLEESIYKEKELNEIKSRFVSMASHEFRTPLASILLSCESLISYWKRMDEDQIGVKLNNILEQTNHLNSIVANVMQVSKTQEGKIKFDPKEHDVLKLCRNTIRDFNSDVSLKNKIEFESAFTTLRMKIDKRLMLQTLFNLLSNALKYAQPDPVIIVRLFIQDGQIVLSVKDNGIGIPKRDQKHIFQPFYRAENASGYEGNGLGLNIVRESLLSQGGDIFFKSEENEGSEFFVVLPGDSITKKQ